MAPGAPRMSCRLRGRRTGLCAHRHCSAAFIKHVCPRLRSPVRPGTRPGLRLDPAEGETGGGIIASTGELGSRTARAACGRTL